MAVPVVSAMICLPRETNLGLCKHPTLSWALPRQETWLVNCSLSMFSFRIPFIFYIRKHSKVAIRNGSTACLDRHSSWISQTLDLVKDDHCLTLITQFNLHNNKKGKFAWVYHYYYYYYYYEHWLIIWSDK